MRILHVFDHSLPLQSGYVYRSLGILAAQRKLGWDTVHLTTPRQNNSNTPVELVDDWTFHRTCAPPEILRRLPIINELAEIYRTSVRLMQLARETKPDIIHAHSPVLNALPAIAVGKRFNIPVVYELRALWEDAAANLGTSAPGGLRYRISKMLETFAIRNVDAVVTLCAGMEAEIVSRGISANKITVVPNAVDTARFNFNILPAEDIRAKFSLHGKMVVGFIGSFYHYEGLDFLLSALPRVLPSVPNLKVLLVGGGPQEERLKSIASERGLGDTVIFAGRVKNAEVERYYSVLDIFVCPRHSMRLTELVTPLKPLEAMALGKVVLASDVGGHKELIRSGDTGVLFRAGDEQALADAIADLAVKPEFRKALSARGRSFVEQERSWERSVSNYRPVYERLIEAAASH